MRIAEVVSFRATCDRAHVGCVLVTHDHIIATGYNGSPAGLPHCDDVGHDIEDGHCVRTVHAEENALLQAALHGVSTKGATCYCTVAPCFRCTSRLVSAGISEIIYLGNYRSMSDKDEERIRGFIEFGSLKRYCKLSEL